MDLKIFNKPDRTGRMSREKYLLNNFPEEYNYIIEWSVKNNLRDIPLKEKIYLCTNNLLDKPKCKNPNCDNNTKFKNRTIGYFSYCSNKCIGSDPNIIKQKENKSIKKYGTKTPAESKEIKDKIIKTNNIKYGFNSPMCNKIIQNKSKKTLMENWGVDNPNKHKDIIKKRVKSFKNNISQYKESYKKTSLDKYGSKHPWGNSDIHQKTIDFFYKEYKKRIIKRIPSSSNVIFKNIKKKDKTVLEFHCNDCNKDFNILTYQFYWRANNITNVCTNCYPINTSESLSELDMFNFVKENYDGNIIKNDRNIINPYEIDVYLPELNIGFEFNGLYWHSDKFKNNNYHLDKYNKCSEKGIRLISIWEDDWITKKEICKSFIKNKLNKSSKIGARKLKIKEINYNDSKKFLDENHLQGDCKSSIRLSLVDENNNIKSLMTFSKPRKILGGKNKGGVWELSRFCNLNNISVMGGASKLFKYFLIHYTPTNVFTYSDNMISDGDMYKKLNFKYSHTSKPSYWYVINKIRQHRANWTKNKLIELGHDKNKYEHEIMEDLGYYRVWSCGNKKWIYNN